ncbi:type II toxin-antitoxin system PemK/MazF family toxin [Paenarthrobacter sp. DKR-5]|uniref:type II toxin-antitoxin system PemK/MazF family toxin n=1 Tax=Paenarthrobacter sp. DKR-5 TaxID=2835535 RepID=UPI001BDBFC40|nr:type II toxin-antitoxin system PemK/MazF family toxin [Paenarthrobacter sp. DKR-5]MBT1001707.1 type II toxin-antitoxin system PemK/MazF family toxin [Paenarthrobacter sp. DKR-5]
MPPRPSPLVRGFLRALWRALTGTAPRGRYPGDFTGRSTVLYSPRRNGRPEPGEVVWAWVPFEEDHGQGKDRPVLLVGRDRKYLLGLMLTSKNPPPPGATPGRKAQRSEYLSLGAGPWDRQGRGSTLRLDRVLRVDPAAVRREGGILERVRFSLVADALRARHGWR